MLSFFQSQPKPQTYFKESWYNDEDTKSEITMQIEQFTNFVAVNQTTNKKAKFIVTDTSDCFILDDKYTTLVLYKSAISSPFKPPLPLDKPLLVKTSWCSIEIKWCGPDESTVAIKSYRVFYRKVDNELKDWEIKVTLDNKTHMVIDNLQPCTQYIFKLQAEYNIGFGPESQLSDIIQTESLPLAVRCQMLCKRSDETSSLPIYEISTKTIMNDSSKRIAKVTFGHESCPPKPTKVLMFVGATGAGKSTLINGMTNFLLDVKYTYDFRFKLVIDEDKRSQAHSQTEWITAYTFYWQEGFPVPYNLTIIDTPGFGDTKGPEKDRKITEQVKDLFSIQGKDGIDQLHGIGFVTQASLARLTPTQKYVFDSILSIFGKDIKDNIFLMTTFADGAEPPVIEAVKIAKIPYNDFFSFNNSALFTQKKQKYTELFWDMCNESFCNFFKHFEKSEGVSLQLTRKVLREREWLECLMIDLQPQINMGLSKMEELNKKEVILKQKESDILANKDFTYKVKVTKQRKMDIQGTGRYVTNCLTCNFTCHYPCGTPNNDNKHQCSAMDSGGQSDAKCTVCPGHCHWTQHVNNSYYFELYDEMETRTSPDLKARYQEATSKKANIEDMVSNMQKELDKLTNSIFNKIQQIHQCLQCLGDIALKPNPLTEVEYIHLLIESEKNEKKAGWQHRIHYFQRMKEQAKIMNKIATRQEIEHMPTETKTWWDFWRK